MDLNIKLLVDGLNQYVNRYFLFSSVQAEIVGVLVFIIVASFVVSVWMRRRGIRRRHIVMASLCVPVLLAVLLILPDSFRGESDERCKKYGNGLLLYSYVTHTVVLDDPHDPYGMKSLVLLVRATSRWGDAVHMCQLSFADEKTHNLYTQLNRLPRDSTDGRGVATFQFGGSMEVPNVRWHRKDPPEEKTHPPEISKKRDLKI